MITSYRSLFHALTAVCLPALFLLCAPLAQAGSAPTPYHFVVEVNFAVPPDPVNVMKGALTISQGDLESGIRPLVLGIDLASGQSFSTSFDYLLAGCPCDYIGFGGEVLDAAGKHLHNAFAFAPGTVTPVEPRSSPQYLAFAPSSFSMPIYGFSDATLLGSIEVSISAVPEPETYALLLAGLGVLGVVARRRAASATRARDSVL